MNIHNLDHLSSAETNHTVVQPHTVKGGLDGCQYFCFLPETGEFSELLSAHGDSPMMYPFTGLPSLSEMEGVQVTHMISTTGPATGANQPTWNAAAGRGILNNGMFTFASSRASF